MLFIFNNSNWYIKYIRFLIKKEDEKLLEMKKESFSNIFIKFQYWHKQPISELDKILNNLTK